MQNACALFVIVDTTVAMALFLRVARMITSLLDFQRTLTSHSMQELNIAYSGRKMLFYTDHIIKAWHELASPFCLTLIDRTDTTHGQVVLQVAIDRGDISFPGNSASSVHEDPSTTPFDQQQALPALQFMHRDCDRIFDQLSDYSASFLDMATLQHPITLTRFTLDISQISRASLASVQNILHRSLLEHVHVVCMDTSRPSPRCCPVAHTQVPGPLWREHQRLGQPLAFVFGSGPTTAHAPHLSHGESSAGIGTPSLSRKHAASPPPGLHQLTTTRAPAHECPSARPTRLDFPGRQSGFFGDEPETGFTQHHAALVGETRHRPVSVSNGDGQRWVREKRTVGPARVHDRDPSSDRAGVEEYQEIPPHVYGRNSEYPMPLVRRGQSPNVRPGARRLAVVCFPVCGA